jgi:dihydroorotate dehydrogenase (NAD+) catalytic subunit
MNLGVRLGALRLESPLIGASGLFGYGSEYAGLVDYSVFGAVVAKTITLAPRDGNPPPRIFDTAEGVINSIGLENVGLEAFLAEKLPRVSLPCRLIVSIGGGTADEYRRLAGALAERPGIDALEVNISCPNVDRGGAGLGQSAGSAAEVIRAVRSETRLAVLAKIPPVIPGIDEIARAACGAGADGLVVANTFPAMVIDPETERPRLGGVSGGLGGGAVRPLSLLLVWKVAASVSAPVIASGGIERAEDAIEYLLAGAAAFEIGSVILKDFEAPSRIIAGLEAFMKRKGYQALDDFRGKARRAARGRSDSECPDSGGE